VYGTSITNSPGPGIGISAWPISIAAPLEGIHAAWLLIFVILVDLGPCKVPNLKVRLGFQRAERVGRKDKGLLKFVHARMDCCYEYK
jgi:hypothetical protein